MTVVFDKMDSREHEEIVFCRDKDTGLKAIIAVHNTAIGPALGGCRMWNYENESAALEDVLRLSRGMSYKAAIAGLNLGGGKAVIIGDSKKHKNEILFRSFSDSLKMIGGRYFSARGKKIDNILQMIKNDALKKTTLASCIIKKVNQTVIISKEY